MSDAGPGGGHMAAAAVGKGWGAYNGLAVKETPIRVPPRGGLSLSGIVVEAFWLGD